jgi:hypothetical protein
MAKHLTVEELVVMMLHGENDNVVTYLRSLPSTECEEIRLDLVEKLQFIKGESPRV